MSATSAGFRSKYDPSGPCPICEWSDGSHNSRCWIAALLAVARAAWRLEHEAPCAGAMIAADQTEVAARRWMDLSVTLDALDAAFPEWRDAK